jgi:hypothetical protein
MKKWNCCDMFIIMIDIAKFLVYSIMIGRYGESSLNYNRDEMDTVKGLLCQSEGFGIHAIRISI